MTENEEVVMTPLLAPEGVTVLKVERVSRGLLDPRTVHYVAGGRYKGIIINRAAKERPEHRAAHARRKFTCYIGAKIRGEPSREQRQLRFWFRHGSSDVDPMADRFFKELINPHLFPRDYIGYVKRILQLLQGYPTVAKMELEMRPARPDEEDQQYVVRRVSRQNSQPPPGAQQDDYHTWHAPPKAASRGELGNAVDALIAAVNSPTMSRSWDGRRRYSIDSLDSADFRGPVDGYRVHTSSPRIDRKGTLNGSADLNALLQGTLPEGVGKHDHRPPPGSADSSPRCRTPPPPCAPRPASEILRPTYEYSYYADRDKYGDVITPTSHLSQRLSMPAQLDTTNKRHSIRVLKMSRSQPDISTAPAHHIAELNIPPQNRTPWKVCAILDMTPRMSRRVRSTAFIKLGGPAEVEPEVDKARLIQEQTPETPETHQTEAKTPQPEPEIEPEIASELTEALPNEVHLEPPDNPPVDVVEHEEPGADDVFSSDDDVMDVPNADVIHDPDAGGDLDEVIGELATQYQKDEIDCAGQDPGSTYMSGPNPVGAATWRRYEDTSHQAFNLTSRTPSPARVVIRKLPPSPIVTRVKSSPVTIRRGATQMPVVTTTHTRVLNPPVAPPPAPTHPGLSRRGVQVLWVARRYRVLKLLEDAYPNSVTADELLRYYMVHAGRSTRLVDVVALTSILKWLSARGLVREVEPGQWMRLETVRSSGHHKWSHVTQIVTDLPTLPHLEMPQVAIVTLLYSEKLAVDAMIDNKKTYVWRRPHDKGEGQVITLGNIGHVRVVSTKLPKPGEGESAMLVARNATFRVIGAFTSISRILLVGVAGGIAHFTDDRRHIRRGDIVVCKPKQSRAPMYIYCTGTERSVSGDYRFASRNWVTKDETLENLINSFQIRQRKDINFCVWERYIQEGLVLLQGGDVDFQRPEPSTDRLVRFGSDGRPHEVPHPAIHSKSARDLRPGQPMVHYDVVGGGEALLGDYNKRRTFAMLTGAKAIDIGYQPVLEAIEEAQKDSVAIIRGIADYNDGRSDAYWQPYASLAAAAFTKALLLELPVEK